MNNHSLTLSYQKWGGGGGLDLKISVIHLHLHYNMDISKKFSLVR